MSQDQAQPVGTAEGRNQMKEAFGLLGKFAAAPESGTLTDEEWKKVATVLDAVMKGDGRLQMGERLVVAITAPDEKNQRGLYYRIFETAQEAQEAGKCGDIFFEKKKTENGEKGPIAITDQKGNPVKVTSTQYACKEMPLYDMRAIRIAREWAEGREPTEAEKWLVVDEVGRTTSRISATLPIISEDGKKAIILGLDENGVLYATRYPEGLKPCDERKDPENFFKTAEPQGVRTRVPDARCIPPNQSELDPVPMLEPMISDEVLANASTVPPRHKIGKSKGQGRA